MASENKVKLPFRSAFSLGDKSPKSPPVGLLLNHGKPNFTINRGSKPSTPLSPLVQSPTEEATKAILKPPSPKIVKSTPSWVPPTSGPNEASKVILRKTQFNTTAARFDEPSEPEFIVAQRRMAEKLSSKDLEQINLNRNSYHTEMMVMSTPTSTKLVGIPSVEKSGEEEQVNGLIEVVNGVQEVAAPVVEESKDLLGEEIPEPKVQVLVEAAPPVTNGDLIEIEPKKDLTGDKIPEPTIEVKEEPKVEVLLEVAPPVTNGDLCEIEPKTDDAVIKKIEDGKKVCYSKETGESEKCPKEDPEETPAKPQSPPFVDQLNQMIAQGTLAQVEAVVESSPEPEPQSTSSLETNFEPKTIVSFAKDLSAEPNKYPDTVKTVVEEPQAADENGNQIIEEMAKLKFDIKSNDQDDLVVTPVIVRGE